MKKIVILLLLLLALPVEQAISKEKAKKEIKSEVHSYSGYLDILNKLPVEADLKNVNKIKILLENLPKAAIELGLTKEIIEDEILVTLKSKLPKIEITDKESEVILYVNLSILKNKFKGGGEDGTFNFTMDLEVYYFASVLYPNIYNPKSIKISKIVLWDCLYGIGSNYENENCWEAIKESLNVRLTSFCAKWYKDNPEIEK